MTDRQRMLRNVQMHDFAKLETQLYLDGHPHEENALQYFGEQAQKAAQAREAFEKKFGPLTCHMPTDGNGNSMGWTWMQDPWPWEKEAN